MKSSGYIGEADFLGVKKLNFGIFGLFTKYEYLFGLE